MKTKAAILFLFIAYVTVFASPCQGWMETLLIEEPHRTHEFQGHVQETPWGAFPGEMLFSYEVKSPSANVHDKFYLSAITGEDTFEIRHTWAKFGGFRAGRPSQEILKVPFKPDAEYPLAMTELSFPNCPMKDPAVLKMLSLKDRQLGYRIILPACLKEALKREKEKDAQP